VSAEHERVVTIDRLYAHLPPPHAYGSSGGERWKNAKLTRIAFRSIAERPRPAYYLLEGVIGGG
jgi:hypothetical protein